MSIHPLEPIPATRRLETDRDELFAMEISGHVSGADVENICGLLEGAYAVHDHIDLLFRFVEPDGIDKSEIAEDTVAEARTHAGRHIGRCAAIGDGEIADAICKIFAPAPDVELRHYKAEKEAEAWAWLGASEVPEDI